MLTIGEDPKPNEIPSDHFWNMMMDELVDLDEERLFSLYV